MSSQKMSDPLTLRLPTDVLADVEKLAAICERSRSWIILRALKAYLAAEGKELMALAEADRDIDAGHGTDLDDVISEVEALLKDAAA